MGKIAVAQRQNFMKEFATYGLGDWPTLEHLQSRSMSQGYGSFCHKFLTQQEDGKRRKSSSLSTFTILFSPLQILSAHMTYHFQ